MFRVLLETTGAGTHVHNSALYHQHGDLMGFRKGGCPLVSLNSTCQPAAANGVTALCGSVCVFYCGHLVHLVTVSYTRIDTQNTQQVADRQLWCCGG